MQQPLNQIREAPHNRRLCPIVLYLKYTLNTLFCSVLRNLRSGISSYFCNRTSSFDFNAFSHCSFLCTLFVSDNHGNPVVFENLLSPIKVLLYLLGDAWGLSFYVFQFMPLNSNCYAKCLLCLLLYILPARLLNWFFHIIFYFYILTINTRVGISTRLSVRRQAQDIKHDLNKS
jgi:hypothetical protein